MSRAPEEIAIRASGLAKTFRLPHETRTTLREYVIHPFRRTTYEIQEALTDVSFSIKAGEFFGIIGRNGSGKSTLLKILAGIYRADRGSVALHGKLSPFIELGVGFNPELNARDNIRINGTLLGLSPAELARRFEEIVAFAELERFVDQSLKNYSSGMQLRLAYAIAIQVPFDILLLDEVLAVGDQDFQEKCFATFERMREEGKTVVLVTHGLDSVARFCDRALLLRDGIVQRVGPPEDVIDLYLVQEKDRAESAARGVSGNGGGAAGRGLPQEASVRGDGSPRPGWEVLEEVKLAVRRSREEAGRHPVGVLERVIHEQEVRLERASRLSDVAALENELKGAEREILQLTMMTEILMRRQYEEMPLPPEELRLRVGKTASELNFLAQGLTAADLVLRVLGESPQSPVLEWGCGSGRTASWLVAHPAWRANYHGCDPDEEAITWLANQGPFHVQICRDAPPLPYPSEMFGAVFSLGMLTHIPPESHRSWYEEIRRILLPGGVAYVTTHGPSSVRKRAGQLVLDFEATGSAFVSNTPHRSAAFVSEEYTRRAVEGLFTIERYEDRGHKTMDAYVLRRADGESGETQP